jgi:hypothetical protein
VKVKRPSVIREVNVAQILSHFANMIKNVRKGRKTRISAFRIYVEKKSETVSCDADSDCTDVPGLPPCLTFIIDF